MLSVTNEPDAVQQGYATLALDPLTGDLPTNPYILIGPDAVIQKLRIRYQFFKGEWFLDRRLGIPYKESILVKKPDLRLITFIFRQVLLTTPGVAKVTEFAAKLDKISRTLTVDFEAVLSSGAVLIAAQEPFLLG